MYILCTPQNQVDEMLNILCDVKNQETLPTSTTQYSYAISKSEIMPLPLMELEFFADKIQYLEQNINAFDYIILSSPSVIEALQSAIKSAIRTKFITVGVQSANAIMKHTSNEVIYPESGSGRMQLFTEKIPLIDFTNKKVLLVKGCDVDSYNEILAKYPQWQVLDIYKKVNLAPKNTDLLKKLLTDATVKGIIITTSILVDELFKLINALGCRLLLTSIPFIVIHPQISEKLKHYGIENIHLTNSANKNEILNLIRSLNV